MPEKTDWNKAVLPLLKRYRKTPHPLDYKNTYQLVVMVVLSARDNDKKINSVVPEFFRHFPDFRKLSFAEAEMLHPLLSKVVGFRKKSEWLVQMAKTIQSDEAIPVTLEALVKLPGIGRKSAHVIRRQMGEKPLGIVVDLHVVRVAQRSGIATGSDPLKIEEAMMKKLKPANWDAGMCFSFLGREICRPSNPACTLCPINRYCKFYTSAVRAKNLKTKTGN